MSVETGRNEPKKSRPHGAGMVAAGILFSRILGLVRERIFAHYFGNSAAADAFKAALRIPNILQNLLGEGVLSGSFIPVYARLVGRGDKDEANQVAFAVLSLLSLLVGALVAIGITAAPSLVDVLAPGFADEKRELAIQLTRIFFPATGILVISAWCLGVLNSHHRFFLPYAAPVAWNLVIIAALIFFGGSRQQDELAVLTAWAVVVGGCAQCFIQLPQTLRMVGRFRFILGRGNQWVKQILSNFFPVLMARGVVQISAYVDSIIASLLPTGAVAALSYAQNIYFLPIGLFGMSVSAAELPTMSQIEGHEDDTKQILARRMAVGLRQIAFFIIPTCAAFWLFGDYLIAALYQTGRFQAADVRYVWLVLAASTVGLFAATWARLYSSAFYALQEPRTPLRYACLRVGFSVLLGVPLALYLPAWAGIDRSYGLIGLCFASALAAILEYSLLRHKLQQRISVVPVDRKFLIGLWTAVIVLGGLSRLAASLVVDESLFLRAATAVTVFSTGYFAWSYYQRYPELQRVFAIAERLLGRQK